MNSSAATTFKDRMKSHSVLLVVFILVVLGVVVWKLTNPATNNSGPGGEGFLDAGLAEIRAQVLASAYKKQSPDTGLSGCQTGLCPLAASGTGSQKGGVAPCFLGLKDTVPGNGSVVNSLKPLPEQPRALPQQFPKCIRCEDVINRAISITPANGAFGLGHFLAKKKDNNSVVIIPEMVTNSSIRCATDGNFRLIIGLSDPVRGVSIYHPESDRVIARDAAGRVALVPISDFGGALASAATFELVDGPVNYSAVAFKCIPINGESANKYLGFGAGTTPGGSPLMILTATGPRLELPTGSTYEFDLLDIETGVPVIMNKHSGLECQAPVNATNGVKEGFWSGDYSDESSRELRDKRIAKGLVLEDELGPSEIREEETNGMNITNAGDKVVGYQELIGGMLPTNIAPAPPTITGSPKVLVPSGLPGISRISGVIDRPFAVNDAHLACGNEPFADAVGMLPATLEELGRVPDNLFQPASGLAFNNALNVNNQIYKDQLTDNVFKKLNAAKMSPNVQNILDYNASTYQIYQRENQDFADKISAQNKSNSSRLDGLIGELDKQRVQGMSRDLFFMTNQSERANARPIYIK